MALVGDCEQMPELFECRFQPTMKCGYPFVSLRDKEARSSVSLQTVSQCGESVLHVLPFGICRVTKNAALRIVFFNERRA